MTSHVMLPCVECHVMTRGDRPRCPQCQRRANWRFVMVSLILALCVLWTWIH